MVFPLPVLACFAVFQCETTEFQNQMKFTKGLLQGVWQPHKLVIKQGFMKLIVFKGQAFPTESASRNSELTVDSGS